jgi:hypothetical protein
MTASDTASAAAGAQAQDGRARGAAAAGGCSAEERATAVQQVAAAAAQHCRTDPAVALEVAMQLLPWHCVAASIPHPFRLVAHSTADSSLSRAVQPTLSHVVPAGGWQCPAEPGQACSAAAGAGGGHSIVEEGVCDFLHSDPHKAYACGFACMFCLGTGFVLVGCVSDTCYRKSNSINCLLRACSLEREHLCVLWGCMYCTTAAVSALRACVRTFVA